MTEKKEKSDLPLTSTILIVNFTEIFFCVSTAVNHFAT
jgi:drug/metabolite transporter (DMT)-like permease